MCWSRAKSQEPRVKNIRCLYWLFWHLGGADVDIRPFGKRDSFFLELPFFVFLNGFGVVPSTRREHLPSSPRAHVYWASSSHAEEAIQSTRDSGPVPPRLPLPDVSVSDTTVLYCSDTKLISDC